MFRVLQRPIGEPFPPITYSFFALPMFLPMTIAKSIGVDFPVLMVFPVAFFLPPLIGLLLRRAYWAICWFWFGGLLLALAYLPILAIAASVPLGWRGLDPTIPRHLQSGVFEFVVALFCLPMYWGIYRLLTTRYYQPWTTPDQWEAGTGDMSRWERALYPGLAAELDRLREKNEQQKPGESPRSGPAPVTTKRMPKLSLVGIILFVFIFVAVVLRLVKLAH